jgi:Calcineurin-like phosphoesterase
MDACGRWTQASIKLCQTEPLLVSSIVSQRKILFLGDYVDHGDHQLHVASSLLIMKAQNPDACLLLRGAHEARTTNGREDVPNSFLSQCKAAFPNGNEGERVWTLFNDAFDYLPVCAELRSPVVPDRMFWTAFAHTNNVPPAWFVRMCLNQPRPFTVQVGSPFYEAVVGPPGHEGN